MGLNLIVLTGPQQGQVLDVGRFPFAVGRHPLCDFRPACAMASRHHCTITSRDGKVFVRDLFSRNGTFLNDHPITDEVELSHGDRLRVGSVLLTACVRSGTAVDEDTTPPRARTAEATSERARGIPVTPPAASI